jgi:hypothetical protein
VRKVGSNWVAEIVLLLMGVSLFEG